MRGLSTGLILTATAAASPFAYTLPPDQYREAVDYHRWLNGLHFVGAALQLAVLAALVAFRAGPRLAARLRAPLVADMVLAIVFAAGLPVDAARHWVSLRYGMSTQGWPAWFADTLTSAAVTGALAVVLLPAGIALVRRWRLGWIAAWAVATLLAIVGAWAAPVYFDPLFSNFRPLAESRPALVAPLAEVCRRAGYPVPPSRMFEMDASRTSRAVNAYMTGLGASRRIVIWDTAIQVLTVPRIQTVFAHEVGHYAQGHIALGIAAASAGMLPAAWLAQLLLRRRPGQPIPLILLLLSVLGFLSEPLANSASRWMERQADIYELEAMQGLVPDPGRNAAETDQILSAIDREDPEPGPFIRFWRYDHPPVAERMEFARTYRPHRH